MQVSSVIIDPALAVILLCIMSRIFVVISAYRELTVQSYEYFFNSTNFCLKICIFALFFTEIKGLIIGLLVISNEKSFNVTEPNCEPFLQKNL